MVECASGPRIESVMYMMCFLDKINGNCFFWFDIVLVFLTSEGGRLIGFSI